MKHKSSRPLRILLAFSLALGLMIGMSAAAYADQEYDLWVGGTRVTSANMDDVLGDGKVSYTPADTTTNPVTPAKLTLKGATITSTGSENSHENAAIYADENLTIETTAGSSVTGPNVTGVSFGIRADNRDLTFTGSGKLTAKGGNTTGYNGNSCGISADSGAVTVNGTLDATGGAATNSYGVFTRYGTVTVSADSTLTATGGAAKKSYGVFTTYGTVTVNSALTATGGTATSESCGVDASRVNVNANGNLTVAGGTAMGQDSKSYGVYAYNDITVTGNLTATGGAAMGQDSKSYGVYADRGAVTVNANSTLTATGGTQAIYGKVKNAIAGTGWTNTAGTEGKTDIAVSTDGQDLSSYKKLQFPAAYPTFSSAALELGGVLNLRYYVSYPSGWDTTDDKVVFTVNGVSRTVTYAGSATDSTGRYFPCPVNAFQMADPIDAVYYHGEQEVARKENYTVKENLNYLNSAYTGTTQALVQATMNYGHYIQPYLANNNHWTLGTDHQDMPAYSEIGAVSSNLASGYAHEWITYNVKQASFALALEESTTLRVKVTLNEAPSETVTATAGGESKTPVNIGGNTWQIDLSGIPANALSIPYTFTLSVGQTEVFKLKISALSYVNLVLAYGSPTETEQKALAALYAYGVAAKGH